MPQILVVDDDDVTREQFAETLRSEGHVVLTAASAEEGLLAIHDTTPDAMLIDLRLPKVDGAGLLDRVRQSARLARVPAVIVTGDYLMDDETRTRLHELGADICYKPIWLDDLPGLVTRLVQRRSSRTWT